MGALILSECLRCSTPLKELSKKGRGAGEDYAMGEAAFQVVGDEIVFLCEDG